MKKLIILLLIAFIVISCNNEIKNNKTKITEISVKHQTPKNNKRVVHIEGTWYGTGLTKEVVVTKISDKSYEFHSYYTDGSDRKEITTLNSSNEFQTYNKFDEYFKLVNGKLGVYDDQGIIEFYTK